MFSTTSVSGHAALVMFSWMKWFKSQCEMKTALFVSGDKTLTFSWLICTDRKNQRLEVKHEILHAVDTGPQCLFVFSLTSQNRCRQSRANIPTFSFPRGKVPFLLPAWGKNTKATAILDYSLVNRLYLFQFSLQIVFPCPAVKWDVLGQPLVCFEWGVLGFLETLSLYNLTVHCLLI